jgi:hypothetical protein
MKGVRPFRWAERHINSPCHVRPFGYSHEIVNSWKVVKSSRCDVRAPSPGGSCVLGCGFITGIAGIFA